MTTLSLVTAVSPRTGKTKITSVFSKGEKICYKMDESLWKVSWHLKG